MGLIFDVEWVKHNPVDCLRLSLLFTPFVLPSWNEFNINEQWPRGYGTGLPISGSLVQNHFGLTGGLSLSSPGDSSN